MRLVFSITFMLAALSSALPAFAVPWCATPLAQWTTASSAEGWAGGLDERYFGWKSQQTSDKQWADFQKPAGVWQVKSGILSIVGKTDHWTTRLLPGDAGANQRITARFVVNASSGAELELPFMQVPTRWGFYFGENMPGWDFGVVLRYQDSLNFYRIMLSTSRGQLALWDANGGFLQIVPCPVALGKAHRLDITAHGAHFQAALDDQPVMDYWDRTLPVLRGQVGVSAWKSTVRVVEFAVAPTAPDTAPMPPHQPNFRLDREHLLRYQLVTSADAKSNFFYATGLGVILYDGYEPISLFVKYPSGGFYQGAMKLKPGWRPAYYSQLGPHLNGFSFPQLVGDLPDALLVDGGGANLTARFTMSSREIGDRAAQAMTVRYDAQRDVYRYEYQVKHTFTNTTPVDVYSYETIDPLTYNNRAPGPEVTHRWNYAGHRWWVCQTADESWRRMPMVDYQAIEVNMKWNRAVDFLYPDPAACPAFEVAHGWPKPDKWQARVGMCLWGYDFHHVTIGNPVMKVKAGDTLNYAVTYTALLPDEARKRFEESRLIDPLEKKTGTLAVFDPRGGPLQTTTIQDPASTMVWGGIVDETGGRQGGPALRMDSPGSIEAFIYQHMIEQYAKRWWVRGWFKTKELQGCGVNLRVKYSYAKEPSELFYLGGVGTQDWTWFSFITTALQARDCSTLAFEADGPGQVWVDSVAISALQAGDKPKVTRFIMPPSLRPDAGMLIDLPMTTATAKVVYDESHNGHALHLANVTRMEEDGRGFLRFNGANSTAHIGLQASLEPRDAPAGDGERYKSLFRLDRFTYEFWVRPALPVKPAARMTLWSYLRGPWANIDSVPDKPKECQFSWNTKVFQGKGYQEITVKQHLPRNQWSHVAIAHGNGRVVLYVNGKAADEAQYDPKTPGFYYFAYKRQFDVGSTYGGGNPFRGDLGPFRLYAKTLTAAEVAKRYSTGWPGM
ncbi:MAG: LamG domain-containing protein [Armatimonadota bacterium]